MSRRMDASNVHDLFVELLIYPMWAENSLLVQQYLLSTIVLPVFFLFRLNPSGFNNSRTDRARNELIYCYIWNVVIGNYGKPAVSLWPITVNVAYQLNFHIRKEKNHRSQNKY